MTYIKEEHFFEAELITFFYQASFFSFILIEIKKLFIIEEDLSVSSYFGLITIFYIVSKLYSSNTEGGYKRREYKIFFLLFFSIFLITFSGYNLDIFNKLNIDYYFIKIDQENIMTIVDDRIVKILDTAGSQDKINELSKYSNDFIILLYFLVFALGYAVNANIAHKEAILDDVLVSNVEKNNNLIKYTQHNESLEKIKENISKNSMKEEKVNDDKNNDTFESKTLDYIGLVCRIKIILRIFLLILLIDQLFKNFLTENFIISEFYFRICFVPIFIILDLILTAMCLRYHSINYLLGNYFVMLEFSEDPKRMNLDLVRNHCNNSNRNFWRFYSNLFINCFLPLLIYICFLNRCDVFYKLKTIENLSTENFKFFTGFLETLLYILYSGIILSRSIMSVTLFFYYQIFVKNYKVKII